MEKSGGGNRTEAVRWITISEKLLFARDLMGCKSFATRARDSDPTLSSTDEILAVVDTLLAGDTRVANNQKDWYGLLGLTMIQGRDREALAKGYRSRMLVLNPQRNKFPFSEQAFRLVIEAWAVLSDPVKKSEYDKEIHRYFQPQCNLPSDPIVTMQCKSIGESSSRGGGIQCSQVHRNDKPYNSMSFSSASNLCKSSGKAVETQESDSNVKTNVVRQEDEDEDQEVRVYGSTFWTACPYCYYMYEYPDVYTDCTLRCQNCKMAFHAVVIPSPPPTIDGPDGYFHCWGFLPFGVSMDKQKTWTPFIPMFNYNKGVGKEINSKRKARYEGTSKENRNAKKVCADKDEGVTAAVSVNEIETRDAATSEVSQQTSGFPINTGGVGLNVGYSNGAEDSKRSNQGNWQGGCTVENDSMEGIGLFEGLDEFLNSLQIANLMEDDKVLKAVQ